MIGNDEINIKSPKQLKEALNELWINLKSTAKDKLLPHIDKPVIKKLLEFKELEKLTNTYWVKLIDKIVNNRIHSQYNQLVDTWRFSCNKPNIQQIPKDHWFRECFKAPKWKKLIVCDLSQCELRIMAELSWCKSMMEAYEQWKDLHREMASKIFETPLDKVTDKQRTASKSISFWLIYWMTAFWLAKQLDIETEGADELIENYFKINPEIKNWIEKTQDETLEDSFTKTILWRKRHYEINNDMDEYQVNTILRQSTNAPVQWTWADWLKMAIIDIDKQIIDQDLNASLVAIIHDEVVIEWDEDKAEKIKSLVENAMISAGKKLLKKIPVEVDAWIYNYWTH